MEQLNRSEGFLGCQELLEVRGLTHWRSGSFFLRSLVLLLFIDFLLLFYDFWFRLPGRLAMLNEEKQ